MYQPAEPYLCGQKKASHIKTIIALVAALPMIVGVEVMKYIYQDWEFDKWIGVAVAVDTIVSTGKALAA